MSATQTPRKPSPGISSVFTLARARWRQHWLLLLFITLGMIASITTSSLRLDNLYDWRALLNILNSEPLYLDLRFA